MQQIEMTITASLFQAQFATIAVANIAKAFYQEIKVPGTESEGSFTASVELAVGEACTNSVKYCTPSQAETSKVHILFELHDHELVIRIKDSNPPFDFKDTPEPDYEGLAECGYGIHIMKESMDQVTYRYEDGWNIVTMKKGI
jgi:anti-sigma regulatory factor (Ser/Thr protein kinase)